MVSRDGVTASPIIAFEHLYALASTVSRYDSITVSLRDNVLHVRQITGGRVEEVTCSPRPDDGGRLWFWTSDRLPLGEPALLTDAALAIVRRLR